MNQTEIDAKCRKHTSAPSCQLMACRLFGAMTLQIAMICYLQLDLWLRQQMSVEYEN